MPCADVGGFNVTLCAVHLIAGGDERKGDRKTQIGELNDALRAKWNAQPVVVAGDFNTTPDSGEMNDMYRLTKSGTFQGAGQFHEADMTDPANPSTKPSTVTCNSAQSACRWGQTTRAGGVNKIDYIFFNRQFTSIGSLTASTFAQGANQDHRGVKGSAMIG
nr:endonuclease/exonuclease/phosphatase family protein [Nocardioides flavescens]